MPSSYLRCVCICVYQKEKKVGYQRVPPDELEFEKQLMIRATHPREIEYNELIDSQLDLLDDSQLLLMEDLLASLPDLLADTNKRHVQTRDDSDVGLEF